MPISKKINGSQHAQFRCVIIFVLLYTDLHIGLFNYEQAIFWTITKYCRPTCGFRKSIMSQFRQLLSELLFKRFRTSSAEHKSDAEAEEATTSKASEATAEAIEATTATPTAAQNENKDDPRRRQVVDLGEFLLHKFKKNCPINAINCRLIAC